MLTINLYKMRKRENSTKQPSSTDGVFPVTGLLIEDCGVLYPRIRIAWGHDENPSSYNYAWIEEFNRYYWIKEWAWSDNSWIGDFAVDPLASWKTEIGNSQQYVLRSSAQKDGLVYDKYYPTKAGVNIVYTDTIAASGSQQLTKTYAAGLYVLGVIGKSSTAAAGAVSYYVFNQITMNQFMSTLMDNVDWLTTPAEDLSTNLQKIIFNPFDYIVSCMWLPVTQIPSPESPIVTEIPFGWWTLPATAIQVVSSMTQFTFVYKCPVAKHPLAATRGDYLNLNPFSRYLMWASPCGTIPLDATLLQGRNELRIEKTIDIITGQGLVNIGVEDSSGNTMQVALRPCQIGVPINIAQIANEFFDAGSGGIVSRVDNILNGLLNSAVGATVGVGAKGYSAIGDAMEASNASLKSNGTNGSTVAYQYNDHLICYFANLVDADNANLGSPLCKVKTLSEIPGFIMAQEPDISAPATNGELEAIRGHMAAGFFYE